MYILYTTTIKGFRFISAEILGSVKNQGKLRYLILTPENTLLFFSMAVGTFFILYGVVRMVYGIRLREWQKSCPASYFKKK